MYILKIFAQQVAGFGERSLNAEDFWRIAERERIEVIEKPLMVNSFYFVCKMGDVEVRRIYINSNLSRAEWLESALHELAHHFLHPQESFTPLFCKASHDFSSRIEREAEICALVALIPLSTLLKLEAEPEILESEFWVLIPRRLRVYLAYGV